MPSCVIRYCTNYTSKTSKTQGITYHSFPTNELRYLQWVDIIRKQRNDEFWQPNQWSKICSNHFKAEDKYKTSKGLTLLKKSAIPVFNLPPWTQSVPGSSNSLTEENVPGSPNSLTEENVPDLESIFATPLENALKKCVQRISIQKEKLINNNRNLKKQIKRLQKRVSHLSDILKHLKMKNYISDEQLTELNLNEATMRLLNRILSDKRSKNSIRQNIHGNAVAE